MNIMSEKLYNACEYATKFNSDNLSLSAIADTFKVDRHSLSKHLQDYLKFEYHYQNSYYYISNEEKIPVIAYLNNSTYTFSDIQKIYKIKSDTLKRRLSVMGYDNSRRYQRNFNRNAFDKIETEADAYWLGFILADGYINEDRQFLKIKLGKKDKNHLLKFANYMQEENPKLIEEFGGAITKDNLCVGIEYDSSTLIENLKKYKLCQAKSGKEIPIYFNDIELTKAYIRGIIDGDGCISPSVKGIKVLGSLATCEYIKDFFGKYYNYQPEKEYIHKYGVIYCFELKNKIALKVIKEELYQNATIYLDRKYKQALNIEY